MGGHARTHGARAGRAPRRRGDRAHGRAVLPLPPPPAPPARARMTVLLEAERVSFAYGPRVVLSEVSVAVAPGELLSVIGPNGSGKTTLVRARAGAGGAPPGRADDAPRSPPPGGHLRRGRGAPSLARHHRRVGAARLEPGGALLRPPGPAGRRAGRVRGEAGGGADARGP